MINALDFNFDRKHVLQYLRNSSHFKDVWNNAILKYTTNDFPHKDDNITKALQISFGTKLNLKIELRKFLCNAPINYNVIYEKHWSHMGIAFGAAGT